MTRPWETSQSKGGGRQSFCSLSPACEQGPCERLKALLIREQDGKHGEALRAWRQPDLGSNSGLTHHLFTGVCPWLCHLTSLSLTLLACGMGVIIPTSQGVPRIAEILYIKCLASDLAYSECSVVELVPTGKTWEGF